MKKKLTSYIILLACLFQFFSLPAFSYDDDADLPPIFQLAVCSDKEFIAIIDEATENDDYIDDDSIVVVADSSASLNSEEDEVGAIMHEDELFAPISAMSDILDYEVDRYNNAGEVYLHSDDNSLVIATTPDSAENDETQGVLIDGVTYVPVADIATATGYQVTLSDDGTKARLSDKFITRRLFIKLKNTDVLTDYSFAEIFLNTEELAINSDGLIFALFNTESETEKAYNLLKSHPSVVYAEPDGLLNISFDSNYTWGTEYCNADYFALNNQVIQNNEDIITVAVIDSGLNAQDPIFEGRVVYDDTFTGGTADTNGHGTHVAGIIAAFTQSVADNVKICPYKLEANEDGTLPYTTVANMYSVISKASKHEIINMSFSVGPMSSFQTLQDVITNSKNSLFVAAAGNDSEPVNSDSLANFVQAKSHGIGVTAIDRFGVPADFSNYTTSSTDYYIAAPGVNVRSTYYLSDQNYVYMNGTSQATPHVSGACAILYLMTRTTNTPQTVKNTLFSDYCVAPSGWNSRYGRGILYFSYKTSGKYAGIDWSFENNTLTLSGSGELPQNPDTSAIPWIFHKDFITNVSLCGNIGGITRESLGNLPLLENIEIDGDNTYYTAKSGTLFSKDEKTLLFCPGIENGCEFIIPDGTVSISDNAFKACKDLVSVVIPTSVTSIGKNAFSDCLDLAHIYYPGKTEQWSAVEKLNDWDKNAGSETYEKAYELLCSYNAPTTVGVCGDSAIWKYWEIGGHLYIEGKGAIYDYDYVYDSGTLVGTTTPWSEYKDYMLSLEIDNGITVIGEKAFNSCGGFTDIVLADTVTTIKAEAFDDKLKTLTLSKNFSDFDIAAFAKCSSLESFSIDEGNTRFSTKDGVLYNKDGSEICYYPNGRTSESFALPEGVKKIGDGAFSKNYRLKYISFNEGLEEIGNNAFKGTTMYSLSALPESLKYIGASAFENCDNITFISLPEGLTSIGERAFFSCDRLKEIYLPSSLEKIDGYVFASCNYINKICFNGTQEKWNSIQFANGWNTGIEDIPISFDTEATASGSFGNKFTWKFNLSTGKLIINGNGEMTGFENYSPPWEEYIDNVTAVELTGGITNIKDYAFYEHKNIISVTLPESIECIGKYAFHNCALLGKINLPDNLKIIDDYAFYKCAGISEITLPQNLETIGSGAFTHCKFEKISIPEGVTSIGSYAFYGTAITSVVIPDKVTEIPEYTFAYCNKLTSVTIPKSVKSIEKYAFYCDYYLADVYYKGSKSGWSAISKNSTWNEKAGANTANRAPIIHYGEANNYSGTFGDNLTWIYWIDTKNLEIKGTGAMPDWTTAEDVPWHSSKSNISSITVSEGVTTIGNYAFSSITSVSEIELPTSVTSIGSNAFNGCTALTTISLSDNVTSIGDNAFYGCSALNDVTLPPNLTVIGQGAFRGCVLLKEITIPEKVTKINAYTFYNCRGLSKVSLPENVTEIGNYAFYNCTALGSISLPGALTSIGDYAFENCSGIKTITLPDKVTTVGIYAFKSCTALETVVFPDNFAVISDGAFYSCSYLKSLTTPAKCTTIGKFAFAGCTLLESVTISEGCTTIDEGAFYSCSKMNFLSLPGSLTSIGSRALGSCMLLSDIYYNGTREKWDSVTKATNWDSGGSAWDQGGRYTIHCTDDKEEEEEEDEILYSGNCGDSLTWEFLTETGVLKITGSGAMTSWTSASEVPWYHLIDSIIKVEIDEGVTTIGDYSFYNYSNLTSVELPKSLTRIGYAFANCYYLADVYYAGSESKWNSISKSASWANSAGLRTPSRKYTLHYAEEDIYSGNFGNGLTWTYYATQKRLVISGAGAIPNYTQSSSRPWNKYASNITSITLEDGVTAIGSYAFSELTKLTTVILPASCTSIGDFAFNNCTLLKDIEIPEKCTYIGNSAFYYCRSIKSITIPKTCKIISNYAFYYCTILESVTIEKGCTTIGSYAFYYSKLKSATIPEGCTTIGSNAFYNSWSLSSVYLPKSLTRIESKAFGDCPSLTNIYYAGTKTMWNSVYKASGWNYLDSSWGTVTRTVHYEYDNAVFVDKDKISVTLKSGVSAKLLVVCYDGQSLVGIKLIPVSESSEISIADLGYTSVRSIKAYLWEDKNSISPLCEAKAYNLP